MKTANVGRGFDLSFKRFKSGHTQSGDTRSKLRISLIFLLLTTLIASSGCSMALRFGYNHADWFVYRSLKPYINLNDEQRVDFDQRFDEIWQWHRTSELPRYAAELRRLAAETANPPEAYTAELVKQQTFRFGEIFIRASEHLLPDAVAILEDLNDKQVEKLLAQLQEDNDEYAEEYLDLSDEDRREKSFEDMQDGLEPWLDDLNSAQEVALRNWAETRRRNPEEVRAWLRVRWLHFRGILANRKEPVFAAHLKTLISEPRALQSDHLKAETSFNRDLWFEMLAQVFNHMTSDQREHAQQKLLDYAQDFEQLARQDAGE